MDINKVYKVYRYICVYRSYSTNSQSDVSPSYIVKSMRLPCKSMVQSMEERMEYEATGDRSMSISQIEVNINSFDIKFMVGEGNYGKVYLVRKKDTGKLYFREEIWGF